MALTIKPGIATTSRPKPLPAFDPFRSIRPHPLTPAPAPIPSLGPPGPPSIPAAAATQQPFIPPPDPGLDQAIGGINATRDTTLAGLRGARTTALLGYGYNEDPTSGALTLDTANPFSRAALLKRSFDQQRAGNTTSYAARGQLYAGSLSNAMNESNFQEQKGSDALLKGLAAFLAGNTQQATQAGTTANTNIGLASSGSLSNVIANALKATS